MKNFGMSMKVGGGKEEMEKSMEKMEELRRKLGVEWEERRKKMEKEKKMKMLREKDENEDNWIEYKEDFMKNDEIGV